MLALALWGSFCTEFAGLPSLVLVSWQSYGLWSNERITLAGAFKMDVLLEQFTERCAVWLSDCCLVRCEENILERERERKRERGKESVVKTKLYSL